MAHTIFDSESLAAQRLAEEYEAKRQIMLDAAARMEATKRFLYEGELHNFEKQAGHQLGARDFEKRVQKLVPSLHFSTRVPSEPERAFLGIPAQTNVRIMSQLLPDSSLKYIASWYDRPLLPEFTVVLMRRTRVPAIMPFQYSKEYGLRETVKGSDFPSVRADGTFDGPTPLDRYIEEPSGTVPGWRSALVLLIASGLTSPGVVEREFGSADRATWAHKTGKQQHDLLV